MKSCRKKKSLPAGRQIEKINVLSGGGVILSPSHRSVFLKDTKIKLQKKEFDVLKILMEHSGRYLEQEQILRIVWGEEYSERASNSLWRVISVIRGRLSEATQGKDYIKAERDVGYRFSP